MLEFMEFIISDYLGEKIHHPDVLANLLLKAIEEAGMLPPYFQGSLTNYDIAMGSNPYRWESEDD